LQKLTTLSFVDHNHIQLREYDGVHTAIPTPVIPTPAIPNLTLTNPNPIPNPIVSIAGVGKVGAPQYDVRHL